MIELVGKNEKIFFSEETKENIWENWEKWTDNKKMVRLLQNDGEVRNLFQKGNSEQIRKCPKTQSNQYISVNNSR